MITVDERHELMRRITTAQRLTNQLASCRGTGIDNAVRISIQHDEATRALCELVNQLTNWTAETT